MWSTKVYNPAKIQTHSPIGEYFTDQNNVNFRPFFIKKAFQRVNLVIGSYVLDETA